MATGDVYDEGSGVFSQKVRIVSDDSGTKAVSLADDYTRELGRVALVNTAGTAVHVARLDSIVGETNYGLVVMSCNYAWDSLLERWKKVPDEHWGSNF